MRPEPVPQPVRELFDYLMTYAATGNLGVISALDKATGRTRYVLLGRHPNRDGSASYVPLGDLSTTIGDELVQPGEEPDAIFILEPDRFDEFLLAQAVEADRWADDGGSTHDG